MNIFSALVSLVKIKVEEVTKGLIKTFVEAVALGEYIHGLAGGIRASKKRPNRNDISRYYGKHSIRNNGIYEKIVKISKEER